MDDVTQEKINDIIFDLQFLSETLKDSKVDKLVRSIIEYFCDSVERIFEEEKSESQIERESVFEMIKYFRGEVKNG